MSWLKNIAQWFVPQPVQRDPVIQQALDARAAPLALYHFPSCPYCLKVRWHLHRLNLHIELRDAQHNEHRQALLAGGGIEQVPCLRIATDAAQVRWLYESNDIIHYLNQVVDYPN